MTLTDDWLKLLGDLTVPVDQLVEAVCWRQIGWERADAGQPPRGAGTEVAAWYRQGYAMRVVGWPRPAGTEVL